MTKFRKNGYEFFQKITVLASGRREQADLVRSLQTQWADAHRSPDFRVRAFLLDCG